MTEVTPTKYTPETDTLYITSTYTDTLYVQTRHTLHLLLTPCKAARLLQGITWQNNNKKWTGHSKASKSFLCVLSIIAWSLGGSIAPYFVRVDTRDHIRIKGSTLQYKGLHNDISFKLDWKKCLLKLKILQPLLTVQL